MGTSSHVRYLPQKGNKTETPDTRKLTGGRLCAPDLVSPFNIIKNTYMYPLQWRMRLATTLSYDRTQKHENVISEIVVCMT